MNKSPLLLCFSFALYACGPRTGQASTTAYSDTTVEAYDSPRAAPDSATLEQAKIAYGALRFGMTESEVDKLPEKERDNLRTVGNDRYTFRWYYDRQGKLYFLELNGIPESASYLDSRVRDQVENLAAVIGAKYGEPLDRALFPTILELQPDKNIWLYKWMVASKSIYVGVTESTSGATYKAVCYIYDTPMHEAQQAANEKEDSANIKEAAAGF